MWNVIKLCIEQHFNSSILIVSPFMSDTRLASFQTLVTGADMLGQHTKGPQDVKPGDIDELIRATKPKHKMMMHELKWFYVDISLSCPSQITILASISSLGSAREACRFAEGTPRMWSASRGVRRGNGGRWDCDGQLAMDEIIND